MLEALLVLGNLFFLPFESGQQLHRNVDRCLKCMRPLWEPCGTSPKDRLEVNMVVLVLRL